MAEPEAEDPSTACSGLSYESWSLAKSTFSIPGETDLDVSMWRGLPGRPHPTWHCPTSKRTCLENLIFLPTDAEFQSRCLRHVCSVCVVLWLGWKQSTECGESVWKAPLHAWLFEHVCFIPGTWLVAVRLPRWGLEDFSRFPLAFQGKHSWISEQDYSISGVVLMVIATWTFISVRISWGADHPCRFPSHQEIWGATPESAFLVTRTGFPGGTSGRESTCQCRRCKSHGFNPWVRKIFWGRLWRSTPVFVPVKSHGQRKLAGYSPWGHKVQDTTERLSTHIQSKPSAGFWHRCS